LLPSPAHCKNTELQLLAPGLGLAARQAEHWACVPVTQGPAQYVVVQLNRATRQVWQLPESAGLLPERHEVTQLSGWPMQLVPQLAV
jgi:transposase